jgi:hypothetical protein
MENEKGSKNLCPVTGRVWLSDRSHMEQKGYIDGSALIRVNAGFWSFMAEKLGLQNQPTKPSQILKALTKAMGATDTESRLFLITLKSEWEQENKPAVVDNVVKIPQLAVADSNKVKIPAVVTNKDLLDFIRTHHKTYGFDGLRKILEDAGNSKAVIDHHFTAVGKI